MKSTAPGRLQVLSAWCCLVAVLLLFAPFAEAAWNAHAAACCTGDRCPIPQHHHSNAPAHNSECEHQSGRMTACSMSCCESPNRLLLAPLAFVLPIEISIMGPEELNADAQALAPLNFPRFLEVLSPPPRLPVTAL